MNLSQLRKKIDELDDKLMALLNERMDLASEIGKLKNAEGKAVYAPERESEIYQKIHSRAEGDVARDALKSIYREIMSASLALEKPLSIAYLGPEASFTHLASMSKFGSSVKYVPCSSINQVFTDVEQKRANYGVIPVENSIEGAVNHSLDMFVESELKICSEVLFSISHHLMSNSDKKHIRRIYSIPQIFGQCRAWIESNLPHAELIETASSTAGAQKAQKEDGAAAIGSKLAATIYGLHVIAEDIQDYAQNTTRFLIVAEQTPPASKQDKTSIVVSIRDKVGALYEMLVPIKKYKINMTKIESRPSKKRAWDYFFFIDFMGHIEDPKIKKMLHEMESKVKYLKILGSYPASSMKEY